MTRREHCLHARRLIEACGGPVEAATACRLGAPALSRACNPESDQFLPADVMADLEAYCGQPIYSRALFEARPSAAISADLLTEGCEAAESAADLQREIRLAVKDGVITPSEQRRLARRHADAKAQLEEVGDLLARVAE